MNKVITNQQLFFNLNAKKKNVKAPFNKLFFNYVNREALSSLNWIRYSKHILDYGCGTGTSIDLFLKNKNPINYNFYGVDIAENAIEEARKKYPQFKFYKITNNKIFQIKNSFLDAVIMFHVLHHSHNHSAIFKEISRKLKTNGRFILNDLSSNNLIVNLARKLFIFSPSFIKKKFSTDLVVNGLIPEKYRVDIKTVKQQLKSTGFLIKEIGYGHLFFFIFVWIDTFIPLSKNKIIRYIYKKLINLEKYLLQHDFFKERAEVFYIKCIKI